MKGIDNSKLDAFLSAHGHVDIPSSYASGEAFGDWRVTAFLGRGGSGESMVTRTAPSFFARERI